MLTNGSDQKIPTQMLNTSTLIMTTTDLMISNKSRMILSMKAMITLLSQTSLKMQKNSQTTGMMMKRIIREEKYLQGSMQAFLYRSLSSLF